MATPKKKHLIELMIESGVKWPEGAEYAAQDKRDSNVYFFTSKPKIVSGRDYYACDDSFLTGCDVLLPSLCRNWHRTIVTRDQYAEALSAVTPVVQYEAQKDPKYCSSVMSQVPDNTIEQLTADYHTKAAEADRLQAVADEALKAADDALVALEKAGELIGLVISIDTKSKRSEQPAQHEITDWRDLRVGDVVVVDFVDSNRTVKLALEGKESIVVADGKRYPICFTNASYPGGGSWWVCGSAKCEWRFIRRP